MQIWIKYISSRREDKTSDKYLKYVVAHIKYRQRDWIKGEVTTELVEEGEGLGVWDKNE